ncbi:MAG: nuclear transport factor 2 family protein [Candidatus Tyrphobacter sp.]
MTTIATDVKALATRYIEAAGNKDYDGLGEIVTPDVAFRGPFTTVATYDAFVAALRRMSPIWERNDVRGVFVSGERACVIYDFATNTGAGALPCVELLSIREGRIASSELFFDQTQFASAAAPRNG